MCGRLYAGQTYKLIGPNRNVTWEIPQQARKVTLLSQATGKPVTLEPEPTDPPTTAP